MNKAIIHDVIPPFSFPAYRCETLTNGSIAYILQDNTQDLVSISFTALGGSTQETLEGQAELAFSLLSRGTMARTALETALAVDDKGASLRSTAHRDTSGLAMTGLAEHLPALIEIMSDCLLNARFSEEEFERLQQQALADHEFELSEPNYLAHRGFAKYLFGEHPYARSRGGTVHSLKALNVDLCREFFLSLRATSRWMCIVAGKVDPDEVLKLLEQNLGSLSSTQSRIPRMSLPLDTSFRSGFVDCPTAQQVVLDMGHFSIERCAKDYPALQLTNTIFGGFFLSRLNALIREEKGYTYGIFSTVDAMLHASRLMCSCSVSAENLADSIALIRQEWRRMAEQKITEEELVRARRFILGSFARSMETPQQMAVFLATREEFNLPADFVDQFVKTIASLTIDSVFEVQQRCFRPDELVIVASGPKSEIESTMTSIGPSTELFID